MEMIQMKYLNHFRTKKNMVNILETDALTKEEIRDGCRYVMDFGADCKSIPAVLNLRR